MVTRNFTYIIGSMFLAFSAAIVSSYYIRSRKGLNVVHVYTSLLLVTSNAIMLRYLIPRQKFVGARLVSTHAQRENEIVISRVAKGGMIVFSLGAIWYDTVGFLAEVDCMDVFMRADCEWGTRFTTAIYLILKIFFMGLQTWFLFSEGYTYAKLGYSDTNRHVFIFNSIVNFTVIIYTTFHEAEDETTKNACLIAPGLFTNATNITSDHLGLHHMTECLTHKTTLQIFGRQNEPYLYPFHSEYCILATTLNLILWKHFINSRKPRTRRRVFIGRTWIRSPGGRRHVRARDSMTSDTRVAESDALIPWHENEESVELDTTLTGTFNSRIHIETTNQDVGNSDDGNFGSSGYGTVEIDDVGEEPIRYGGVVAVFRECYRCSGCLNPRPSYIYGPDDGCGLLAFLGFTLSIVYTVPSLLMNAKDLRKQMINMVYILTLILYVVMLIASLLLAIGTHRKLALGPKFHKTLSVGSIVLILSTFIIFFFDFLFAIAAWDLAISQSINITDIEIKYPKAVSAMPLINQNILDVVAAAINCLQVALQTNIVINNHWIMKRMCFDDVIYTSTMMQCTSFLMAANFCKWLVGSSIEAHQPEANLGQILFYGKDAWKFLVNLLYPFVIYYRFHCTMAFGEYMLWRRGLLDAGRVGAGSAGFVPSIGTLAY
jgi:hypothetical protein